MSVRLGVVRLLMLIVLYRFSSAGLPEERACFPDGSERRLLGQRLPRGLQEEHRAASPKPPGDRRPEQRNGPELLDRQVRRHLQGRRGHAAPAAAGAPERRVGAHPQQGAAVRDVPADPRRPQVRAPAAVQRLSGELREVSR